MRDLLSVSCAYLLLISCSSINDIAITEPLPEFNDTTLTTIVDEIKPNLIINQGAVSQNAKIFRIIRNGICEAVVKLGEPVIVSQTDKPEGWGYYQFPSIFRGDNNCLFVTWSMKADSYEAYGDKTTGCLMSRDEGQTWERLDRDYFLKERYRVELSDGDLLQVETPSAKDVKDYSSFPRPVNSTTLEKGRDFYYESELPEDLRGVYFVHKEKNGRITSFHATLNDPGLLRYAINGSMPICWWGNIKELNSGYLIAGIHPVNYLNSKGEVLRPSISFYKSTDKGRHWDILGKIPYLPVDGEDYESYLYDGTEGFEEATFEILNDGKIICVMRTGYDTPMYKSFSSDSGATWTRPEPFTPNGVLPQLQLLGNGVLVLSSGRPGLQLRFSLDGDGKVWTKPIEMLPFMDINGEYNIWNETCGYSSILSVDANTFYMVYSDFTMKNKDGEPRKAILFRKVEIIRN